MFSLNIQSANAVSWYCKRKSDNSQPSLDRNLEFVRGYDLFWCDENHKNIDDADKVIYLTFDAGYENGNVEKILDVLEKENVQATFFILENLILKNEDLVKKMIDNNHIVANHTLKHKDMTKIYTKEEFQKELFALESLFETTFNKKMPKYYRPPEGKFNEENLKWARDLGYKTVMWSFAYADWDNNNQPQKEYALKKILDNVHNGEVMLLHPNSSTNAEILCEVIGNLKKRGFRFATVEELCKE